jgi:hypothetical protein
VNVWYYFEFQATIHASAGAVTLKVSDAGVTTTWASASGVNTQTTANATTNGVRFANAGYPVTIDDFYCLNSSGSVNNTFLGECRILTGLPNVDGSSLQWTPSAGTSHFAMVDETNPNDDTDYVSSATVGQIDLLGIPDIAPSGPILGVQSVLCARKDDVGLRQIADQCKSGATTATGATVTLNTTYGMSRQIRETDPATGAAWTAAGVNAAEFGIKVIA